MSASPRVLTPDILDRFARASRRAGGPLLDVLEPGLSDEQIETLLGPLGLRAPCELATLWRWGQMPEGPSNPRAWEVHFDFALLPPRRAVADTLQRKGERLEHHEPSWLAFAVEDHPRYLAVNCDGRKTASAVVHTLHESYVGAQSMGDLFNYWTRQIETGESYFAQGLWRESDDAGYPLPLQ